VTLDARALRSRRPQGRQLTGTRERRTPAARTWSAIAAAARSAATRIILVGDVNPDELRRVLDQRFGGWKAGDQRAPALPEPVTAVGSPRIALVDRPGAEQTTIALVRPLAVADAAVRPARDCVANLFGVAFTSRLMQSTASAFSYGVHLNMLEGSQG
jgi:predicted Zn-dependent peptidase